MRARLTASYAELSRERDRYRDLLAIVPHEFKTPLAALTASLELLQSDYADLTSDQARSLLQSIHRSTIRLHSLVDNLLDTASIQAGQFQVKPEPSDLADIVHEAWLFVQPLLEQKGQELQVGIPENLPPVMADGPRVTQVLINLLANAVKYGPPGMPLSLEARVDGDSLRIAVTDRGPGIPVGDQSQLFQRFARAASGGAATPPGLGLGLAIVKEIVDMHQGTIGLDSRLGQGTTVWFTLPLAPLLRPAATSEG
jgi:signal transduction histidine kinase